MKTRETIQKECLQIAKDHNYNGVICLSPGTGKTKIAIDCIKQGNFKNVLITSPRTNLKKNWVEELNKWCKHAPGHRFHGDSGYSYWYKEINNDFRVELSNIQTCYKWTWEKLKQFDLIIYDEIHTCGVEYFNLIQTDIPCLGLTGTPTFSDPWKKEVLYKTLPIIYEYYNAEEDGITNKINYQVFEYELSDNYKVVTGTKDKKWLVGELKQYNYLSEQYEKAKALMFQQGASNYFEQCLEWMKSKTCTKAQKYAGTQFFFAVSNRKNFLWNLESSKQIALQIKNKILVHSNITGHHFASSEYKTCYSFNTHTQNKVLLFSELTQQAEKLSPHSIHSNNGKNAKEAEIINKELLERFNKGEIRELSSVNSLSLGLNMNGATHAIFESYSSSNTNAIQKCKRLVRLGVDDIANVIIIKAKGTQMDNWFSEAFKDIEYKVINNINELII